MCKPDVLGADNLSAGGWTTKAEATKRKKAITTASEKFCIMIQISSQQACFSSVDRTRWLPISLESTCWRLSAPSARVVLGKLVVDQRRATGCKM